MGRDIVVIGGSAGAVPSAVFVGLHTSADIFANGSTSMPLSAPRNVEVDQVVPAAEMIGLIMRLANESPQGNASVMATRPKDEPVRAARALHALKEATFPEPPSGFTCPECGSARMAKGRTAAGDRVDDRV